MKLGFFLVLFGGMLIGFIAGYQLGHRKAELKSYSQPGQSTRAILDDGFPEDDAQV